MKPFHELDCAHLPKIQQEALSWLGGKYDLSDPVSLKTNLWLKIDYTNFLRANPSLISWFRELGLACREVAVTVVNDMAGATLHIDELPTTAKINVPILNYDNVINEWYHVPQEIMSSVQPKVNHFGSKFYDLESVDIDKCQLVAALQLKSPVVFNSQIPHRVVCQTSATFPRVVLTCMFFKEPVRYLE